MHRDHGREGNKMYTNYIWSIIQQDRAYKNWLRVSNVLYKMVDLPSWSCKALNILLTVPFNASSYTQYHNSVLLDNAPISC